MMHTLLNIVMADSEMPLYLHPYTIYVSMIMKYIINFTERSNESTRPTPSQFVLKNVRFEDKMTKH